ncbi:DEKNAAC100335 [Brettanomyces naardenensis]|uniref:DEKNAAC100335 n=1 Tax=Brettanomyces naardenensis TaxID=13370 RepID=A0A448YF92_BRENA|nr:DEKNAAC100335 [Brettanomyces naardenensis]
MTRSKSSHTHTHAHAHTSQRRLPAYKIKQLERIKRLEEISSKVRPRTYRNDRYESDPGNDLHVRLSLRNKSKISTLTGYSPVRDRLVKSTLTSIGLEEVKKLVERPTVLNRLSLPSIADDSTLSKALREVKNKLPVYEHHVTGGNEKYVKNEMDLQRMGIHQNYKTVYAAYRKVTSCGRVDDKRVSEFYSDMNSLSGNKFKDIAVESRRFDLMRMFEEVEVNESECDETKTFQDPKTAAGNFY